MLFRYNLAPHTTAALGAVLAFALCLAGCGGGNDNPNAGLPFAAASPAVSRFVGSYTSTVALGGGKTGAVALTVGADNRATGTLTVGDSRGRQSQSFAFASGVYAISGTVDPYTGAFSMTGNIAGQPFSYNGTLPTPGNGNIGGGYTLTYGTQTYTGTFGSVPTATPGPTPSPQATPTPAASPSPLPPTTAVNTLTITPDGTDAHNNSHTGAYAVRVTATGYRLPTTIGTTPVAANMNVKCEEASDKVTFSLNLDMMIASGGLVPGTYPVKFAQPTASPANALFTYQEYGYTENNTTTRSWQSYHYPDAGEGQVVIEQADATKVRVRFENVLVYPTMFQNGVGRLRVNGVVETSSILFGN